MELEDIGFYTLTDNRAYNISAESHLKRAELIITDRCNFKCPYCRGVSSELKGDMDVRDAVGTIKAWAREGLENIRFSGGEPTLYKDLAYLVSLSKSQGVKRIAISTNGSASLEYYQDLINYGVNDFSISLDACCSSFAETMNGGIKDVWEHTINNIRELSKQTYVTVGMVFNENNVSQAVESIMFADSLGVSDIRVISSAQYNEAMTFLSELPVAILDKYPILKYRVKRAAAGENVRGLKAYDCGKCYLVLDDLASIKGRNYPCIIYFREGGDHISIGDYGLRESRLEWFKSHDSFKDKICKDNCLDVCIDFNNKCHKYNGGR